MILSGINGGIKKVIFQCTDENKKFSLDVIWTNSFIITFHWDLRGIIFK